MNAWKHKEWKTFGGTWYIASQYLSDSEIQAIIIASPEKYGSLDKWSKIK